METTKILMVGGKWDDNGGKHSGYINKLHASLEKHFGIFTLHNGGFWKDLENIMNTLNDEILFWFPDIPNEKNKLVESIKTNHPKAFLITSKNNYDHKYEFMHLIAHALKNKSNLLVEFTKDRSVILGSVYDPLGNSYGRDILDIDKLADILYSRISAIHNVKRFKSVMIGERIPPTISENESKFIDFVKGYADVFHNLIHGVNHSRFLGNCSFRCSKGGFPSFRQGDLIYVSRRNIDKREIGADGFVPVKAIDSISYIVNGRVDVEYYGEDKPSVDTPVQLLLYALYPNINYMIHSHTYVSGARFTDRVIPCGAIEEVNEITGIVEYLDTHFFAINLKGHGSIVASEFVGSLSGINYIGRKFPEEQF